MVFAVVCVFVLGCRNVWRVDRETQDHCDSSALVCSRLRNALAAGMCHRKALFFARPSPPTAFLHWLSFHPSLSLNPWDVSSPAPLWKVTPPSLPLLSLAPPPSPVLLCCHPIGQPWAAPPPDPRAVLCVPVPHPPFPSVASAPIGSLPRRVHWPGREGGEAPRERQRHSAVWVGLLVSSVSPAAAADPEDAVRDGAPGQLLLSGRIRWGKRSL